MKETNYKREVAIIKAKMKKKHGTIAKFAYHYNLNDYELRKLLARIAINTGKYLTDFNPEKEINHLNEMLK